MADEPTSIRTGTMVRWLLVGVAVLLGLALYFLYAPGTPLIFEPPALGAGP